MRDYVRNQGCPFHLFSIEFVLLTTLGVVLTFNRYAAGLQNVKIWGGGGLAAAITMTRL